MGTMQAYRTLNIFHQPASIVEVRAIGIPGRGRPHTAAGYFDDFELATQAAAKLDAERQPEGIYFVLNAVNPQLFARSPNVLTDFPKHATSDNDITRRHWLLIDIDPTRPAGIGSTGAQLEAARETSASVRGWLAEQQWAQPVEAMSGNGHHLLYPVDLLNDDESRLLVASVLKALAARFDSSHIKIDQAVFNAARITKFYGTTGRKGHATESTPHRQSKLTYVPDYLEPGATAEREVVPVERLRAVAAMVPKAEQPTPAQSQPSSNGNHRLDVPRWLQSHSVPFRVKDRPTADGRTVYLLDACPFNPEHGGNGEVSVMQAGSGKLSASCKHSSCQGNGWQEFKQAIGAPAANDYDPPLTRQNEPTGTLDKNVKPETGLNVICMADVQPESVEWIWPGRLPLSKLSLLVGQPGVGKSFCTTDFAARVTTGAIWPDQAANDFPGEVVFLCGEDGLADTVRVRLDSANADSSKVFVLDSQFIVQKDGTKTERPIHLDADIDGINSFLDGRPDVRLMVIDPISEFEGGTDSHKNSEVRAMLKPLSRLAEKHRVAIVMVSHFRKSQSGGGPAIYAAMGSLAYSAAARVAWAFIPDTETENQVLILPLKNNLHRKVPGLAYTIEHPGVVHWSADEIEISADDAMARLSQSAKPKGGTQLDLCMAWLKQLLASGPADSGEVEVAADAAGFSTSTFKRARKKLQVLATKNEGTGRWTMSLSSDQTYGFSPGVQTRGSNPGHGIVEPLETLEAPVQVQGAQQVQEDQESQECQNSNGELDYSGPLKDGMDYEKWKAAGAGRF